MIYDNILGTIGRTPVVRINRLAPAGTTMYVKCEFFNPLSSVKDRLAIAIIEDAERTGALKPGRPWWKPPPATPASHSPWCAPPRAIRSSP
jgi:cysteine synthase A